MFLLGFLLFCLTCWCPQGSVLAFLLCTVPALLACAAHSWNHLLLSLVHSWFPDLSPQDRAPDRDPDLLSDCLLQLGYFHSTGLKLMMPSYSFLPPKFLSLVNDLTIYPIPKIRNLKELTMTLEWIPHSNQSLCFCNSTSQVSLKFFSLYHYLVHQILNDLLINWFWLASLPWIPCPTFPLTRNMVTFVARPCAAPLSSIFIYPDADSTSPCECLKCISKSRCPDGIYDLGSIILSATSVSNTTF